MVLVYALSKRKEISMGIFKKLSIPNLSIPRLPKIERKDSHGGRGFGRAHDDDDIPLLDTPVTDFGEAEIEDPAAELWEEPQDASQAAEVTELQPAPEPEPMPDPKPEPEPDPEPEPESAKADGSPEPGFSRLSQVDYWVKISGQREISRDAALAIYRDGEVDLRAPHRMYGFRMPEKEWRDMEYETEEGRYADLVLTMQLLQGGRAATESDLTHFTSLVYRIAESTGRDFHFMGSMEEALQQTRALSDFFKRYDTTMVLHIQPLTDDAPFEGALLDKSARELGLEPDGDSSHYHRLKRMGRSQVRLYTLANLSDTGEFDFFRLNLFSTRGVLFYMKPALNPSPGAVFGEMADTARAFASRIGGEVVVRGGDEFTQDVADKMRRRIEKVAAGMEQEGIAPGSEEAIRLIG